MQLTTILRTGLLMGFLLLAACSTKNTMTHTQTVPDANYRAALEWTDPQHHRVPAAGSPKEAAMLEGVKQLFTNYTKANLEANLTRVYADRVYFRDAFKQFNRSEEIRHYMIEGLAVLDGAEFQFRRIARAGDEFYLDWVMRLDFKKTPPGTWEESIGVTHMRFDSEGRIIFHQDYWDPTDIVYQRIPIAKQLINFVKGKM